MEKPVQIFNTKTGRIIGWGFIKEPVLKTDEAVEPLEMEIPKASPSLFMRTAPGIAAERPLAEIEEEKRIEREGKRGKDQSFASKHKVSQDFLDDLRELLGLR